ncbi:MAG: hypothetical protein QNI86_11465 [Halieaceae bacterium]|nr:hypothetical protein [Halieaceae bacterium]
MTLRIAMWSGPRNISTAMMRSWENRPDCSVVDEPFYACYLEETGLEHPCREAILTSQSTSRAEVIDALTQAPVATELHYQKHMTHHMPRGMDMQWCAELVHCFLVRDPAEVIASYLNKMPSVSEEAIGIVRQAELFEEIAQVTGEEPLVIDSSDVLKNPGAVLAGLCAQLDVSWLPDAMLHWPAGRRDSDGVWAPHWYQSVEASTGFAPYRYRQPELCGEQAALAEAMAPYYQAMASKRIAVNS